MGEVSKEFCGGCHVNNTREIGICKIIGEESIGSGIRRITAKTGYAAYKEFALENDTLHRIASDLKMKGIVNIESKVIQMLDESAALKKELAALQAKMFALQANDMIHHCKEINGRNVLIERVDGLDAKAMKDIVSTIKSQKENVVVFLGSVNDDKVVFVAGADETAVQSGIKCGDLVKSAALICDGKGGGRNDMAQSGGKDASQIDHAMREIANMLS